MTIWKARHSEYFLTGMTGRLREICGQATFRVSDAEGMSASFTSFLLLRYRLRDFKIGAEILYPDGMIIIISRRNGSLTKVWSYGRTYSICLKVRARASPLGSRS